MLKSDHPAVLPEPRVSRVRRQVPQQPQLVYRPGQVQGELTSPSGRLLPLPLDLYRPVFYQDRRQKVSPYPSLSLGPAPGFRGFYLLSWPFFVLPSTITSHRIYRGFMLTFFLIIP